MKTKLFGKYIIMLLFMAVSSGSQLLAQENWTKPVAQEAKTFQFPEYKTIVLSNGLKVYLIKDDEQPTISLRLVFAGGSNLDGQKAGLADLSTSLMSKGAGKRNALEIATVLDGIGADVSASASQDGVFLTGSSLTKHFDKMFEIYCDVLLSPKFPKDEFVKLLDQTKSAVKMRKSNSGTLAGSLSAIATYGPDHPYANQSTEKSLNSIELKDLENYYKSVVMPNNATLAVTGDFNEKDLVKALESKLKNWKNGTMPKLDVPEPKPLPKGIYFVPRPGSKQSSIVISGLTVPRGHKDYLAVKLAAAEMGGGFGSKLFRTLREKYSFTYSPFASATSNKFANRLFCGSEVNSAKTDSSITIILEQLESLFNDGVTTDELNRVKSNVIGNYQMSFENSGFVTSLIQMADFYGESIDDVKNYPQRMDALTTLDLAKVAEKYLKRDRVQIAVVGLPELKDELAKLGYKIYEYTLDLEDAELANAVAPVDLKPEDLIKLYTDKIGGADAVKNIQTMRIESKMTLKAQGQSFPGTIVQLVKYPGKEFQSVTTAVFAQKKWVSDGKAWSENQMGFSESTGDELKADISSIGFPTIEVSKFIKKGYKCKILGERDGMIKMSVKNLLDKESTYFFNKRTYLLDKIESSEESPQGPMQISYTFSDYETIGGVKVPLSSAQITPFFSIDMSNMFYVNEPIDDAKFIPEKANK